MDLQMDLGLVPNYIEESGTRSGIEMDLETEFSLFQIGLTHLLQVEPFIPKSHPLAD